MKRLLSYLSVILFLCVSYSALAQDGTDAITVTVELQVANDEIEIVRKPGRASIDMLGDSISDIIQTFPTGVVTQITIADGIATNGVTYFRNTTTNTDRFIDIGPVDANTNLLAFGRISATERYILRLHPTNLIFATAFGGSVNLRTCVVED